ncbi:MAG TPA: hydrolase [Burkholderiales bacterium]
MTAPFEAAWWCRNPHIQTIFPNRLRPRPRLRLRRERIELPDGDFIDIDWSLNNDGPIVLLLHGLQGSSRSHYARGLGRSFERAGWRVAVMHFRGCSGEPNRLVRGYHSGDTGDVAHVARRLQQRHPRAPLAAVGVSLGGNVLLKWLGETGAANPLTAAVAVSVPFLLNRAADRLDTGFARLYQWDLLLALCRGLKAKRRRVSVPLAIEHLSMLKTIRDFDNHVTAPLHGFRDATHYYAESSSRQYLRDIRVPTLMIQARDDPFMTPDVIPEPHELSACTRLEVYPHGGHVGFVGGRWPWRPRYYLEERVPEFLRAHLEKAIRADRSSAERLLDREVSM